MATHLPDDGPLAALAERITASSVALYEDTDRALEDCEENLLAAAPAAGTGTKWSLGQLDVFRGLDRDQCRLLERIVQTLLFEPGETIIREGDQAQRLFVLARGSVTVSLTAPGGQRRRLACIGPGMSFGEMALLDGGVRSADVIAAERAICYGFSVEALRELSLAHPAIMITILGNLGRQFSDRLRRANLEIRALE
jgi:glutaminase